MDDCTRWVKILGPATCITQDEAIRRFPMCESRTEELGDDLSFWHLSSNRLMVIDEEFEFGYGWCHSRSGWNVMEWDIVLAVSGRCEDPDEL